MILKEDMYQEIFRMRQKKVTFYFLKIVVRYILRNEKFIVSDKCVVFLYDQL